MTQHYFTELTSRALINLTGQETGEFLQGLITCDVTALKPGEVTFGALLSPQGKILFDFFVVASTNGCMLDVDASMAADLTKRLIFYRLRRKIEIEPMDIRTHVFAIWGGDGDDGEIVVDGITAKDPRLPQLGYRAYIRRAPEGATTQPIEAWHKHRIALGIPEGGIDFSFGDAYPHEALMDQFRGVDFTKGCYVGQEVVSRMQHRSTARKRLIKIVSDNPLPNRGTEILSDSKSCGSITSRNENEGLAMVRMDRVSGTGDIRSALAGSMPVKLSIPTWCNFEWQ